MSLEPTVFVVDDDEGVRESLCFLIRSIGLPVEAFSSPAEFIEAYRPERPGCLILDMRLPGLSGLQLQQHLRERELELPIIFVTGHGDVPMAVSALKAGAFDFLEKPYSDQQLLDRVQHCIAEDSRRRQDYAERAALQRRFASLTPRERQVLERVVAGKPNKVIARELTISGKTVEVHRARVMEKMQTSSLANLVSMCVNAALFEEGSN